MRRSKSFATKAYPFLSLLLTCTQLLCIWLRALQERTQLHWLRALQELCMHKIKKGPFEQAFCFSVPCTYHTEKEMNQEPGCICDTTTQDITTFKNKHYAKRLQREREWKDVLMNNMGGVSNCCVCSPLKLTRASQKALHACGLCRLVSLSKDTTNIAVRWNQSPKELCSKQRNGSVAMVLDGSNVWILPSPNEIKRAISQFPDNWELCDMGCGYLLSNKGLDRLAKLSMKTKLNDTYETKLDYRKQLVSVSMSSSMTELDQPRVKQSNWQTLFLYMVLFAMIALLFVGISLAARYFICYSPMAARSALQNEFDFFW